MAEINNININIVMLKYPFFLRCTTNDYIMFLFNTHIKLPFSLHVQGALEYPHKIVSGLYSLAHLTVIRNIVIHFIRFSCFAH